MAASIAIRIPVGSSLLSNLTKSIRPSAVVGARSFLSDSSVARFNDDDDRSVDVNGRSASDRSVSRRRDASPSFFADVFDPFSPTRSLSQVLNMMDQFMESPFVGSSGVTRRGWDVKEDDDALHLRIDMPGLGKEDVKVNVEQNTLIIKGEGGGEVDAKDENGGRRYSSRIDLPFDRYNVDEIKAEMKNGVLKVAVPKVKEEERKNVKEVEIQ